LEVIWKTVSLSQTKMIYQLPNGKIIHLSIEEYLDLSDQDIQYLMSVNAGDYAGSPFHASAIKSNHKKQDDFYEEDASIDYQPELDEPLYIGPSDEESLDEEWPDFPDQESF
jgi:hypothetical protein